jgi:hypothetical protein
MNITAWFYKVDFELADESLMNDFVKHLWSLYSTKAAEEDVLAISLLVLAC